MPLRVSVSYGNRMVALGERGEFALEFPGSFLRECAERGLKPVTGDWMLAEPLLGAGGVEERSAEGMPRALARGLLRRKTDFARKAPISGGRRLASFEGETVMTGGETVSQSLAANVDRVFIVCAVGPGSKARGVERYLVVVKASGADPVVVLNKADLLDDPGDALAELEAVARGVPVIASSALRGDGLEALRAYVGPGETVALVGKSGVGKSALVNALSGEERQSTGTLSTAVNKGRHTTTRRELLLLPGGGILVDTPGMRELQLWGDEEILAGEFDEIEALAADCRFSDCRHRGEPGCAVAAALEEGRLDRGRWESYGRMRRELQLLGIRKEQRARIVNLETHPKAVRPREKGRKRAEAGRSRSRDPEDWE